ncbi:MAG: sodium:alanine symporter family protein [Acidobacteriota bacterium]|nr:sodium:alanine symporter family protein [Acidobacteriota bacterium]MDH3522168.1 sodium:alanine symporter family protein [Acidobacteriota bacterium]
MAEWIQRLSDWLWGYPMLTLVLGTGLYLVVRLRAVQVREFFPAWRLLFAARSDGEGDITPFGALMTAVGGIVGNGNLAGVATAVTAGGPGALFWMWISGIVGMGTMFAESVLGVKYRRREPDGLFVGGPMYYLRDGLGWPRLAAFFAFGLAVKTLLATTVVQSNSIASVVSSELGWSALVTCLLLAAVCGMAIVGGVRSVARTSEILAPLMGVLYLGGAAVVLFAFRDRIGPSLELVVESAFSPAAATGGFLGAGVREAFRFGVARGVYSNEAGTGSVPIAHASARTGNPVRQGKIAMLGVFVDTLVVSTATGLVLLVTDAWHSGLDSTALTAQAFARALGAVGGPLVLVSSVLFGLSTLIAWAFYGEQSAAYLFGPRARPVYRVLYCAAIAGGAVAGPRLTWAWADILNGLMAIPNLIALVAMAGGLARLTRESSANLEGNE